MNPSRGCRGEEMLHKVIMDGTEWIGHSYTQLWIFMISFKSEMNNLFCECRVRTAKSTHSCPRSFRRPHRSGSQILFKSCYKFEAKAKRGRKVDGEDGKAGRRRARTWHNSCHEHKTRRSIRTINYAKKGILLLLLCASVYFMALEQLVNAI